MASVDLLFSLTPVTGHPADLVFGADEATSIAQVEGSMSGVLPAPALQAVLVVSQITLASVHAVLPSPELQAAFAAEYLINVERPLAGQVKAISQSPAAVAAAGVTARYQGAQPLLCGTALYARDAQGIARHWLVRWQATELISRYVRSSTEEARRVSPEVVGVRFQEAVPLHREVQARISEFERVQPDAVRVRFQDAFRDRYAFAASYSQEAVPVESGAAQFSGYCLPLSQRWNAHWQDAWTPRPGRSTRPGPPQPVPCYTPDPRLLFDAPWSSTALVFSCERHATGSPARIVIPILKAYVTINSISLRRVDTGVELHAHGFNMTLDYQSWTWTWSAALHHDADGHLGRESNGDFAELEAVVNGIPFRLRLERTVCDRRFNPTRWAVSGRGKASVLSGPVMSFGNTVDRTAQQLMADALTVNGASLGWAVDWGLTDWLVPAGAWSLRGSYIDAVNDIAAAAGGYVQPHPTDATLRILPRYPVAPWNWGSVAPDFEIPDVAEVEGTEYIDKPGYNKVFVGGVGAGVFGPFKRAGTAGDILAPQVTHALITHADAHRQRGLAVLSDTGRQEHITLKMQVLEETGIIMPGQFVRYTGEKTVVGIVRSTTIDWSRPVLRQTIGIETHA